MPSKYHYKSKTGRLNRNWTEMLVSGSYDPYRMLAAAILFQAAVDCSSWSPAVDAKPKHSGNIYLRRAKLVEFINSDWIDHLLSWQNQITPAGYREELIRRLAK